MNRRSVEVLWLLVLAAMAFVTGLLLFSGDILLYLAPRMLPIAWFGFAMLCILAIFQLARLIRTQRQEFGKAARLYSLMFLIPLILFATVTPNEATAVTLTNPGVKVAGATQAAATPKPSRTPEATAVPGTADAGQETLAAYETPEVTPEPTPAPEVATEDVAALTPCTLTEEGEAAADNFSNYVYTPIEELEGQRITLYGFVYKDNAFPDGTILVSRMLMTCCAADTSLVGFHVRVENTGDFENDEWIQVTGTVKAFEMEYEGDTYTMPVLTDGTIIRRSVPAGDPYIYPY